MSVKVLTEHHLEFLSLKGGCTGSSESTLVKIPLFGNLIHAKIFLLASVVEQAGFSLAYGQTQMTGFLIMMHI